MFQVFFALDTRAASIFSAVANRNIGIVTDTLGYNGKLPHKRYKHLNNNINLCSYTSWASFITRMFLAAKPFSDVTIFISTSSPTFGFCVTSFSFLQSLKHNYITEEVRSLHIGENLVPETHEDLYSKLGAFNETIATLRFIGTQIHDYSGITFIVIRYTGCIR